MGWVERIEPMERERGFTLVELLVVLAILGALAGLTLNAATGMRVRAGGVTAEAELEIVQKALWTHMLTMSVERVAATACTADFAASDPPLYPQYLNLQYPLAGRAYTWDQTGNVRFCERAITTPVGSYYSNRDLSGPAVTRTDAAIDFNWQWDSPHPAVPADDFSVRWEFDLHAGDAGVYRFQVRTDDGVRLWVNDVLIVDQWHDMVATTYYGVITLSPGAYPVRMEYYEHRGRAFAQLTWDYVGP